MMEIKHDYTPEVRAAISESVRLAKDISLVDALEHLLTVEKKCRLGNDFTNLKEVVLHMVRLCREKNDWERLVSTLTLISKRRAQSKHAITAIVQEATQYIDDAPSEDAKVSLISCLKEICEGKIYVEGEGAKLTMMLSKIKESQGDIAAACDAIQDVHVETYGSLSKLEKAQYILEQIRLNLRRKDYVRALIQSRKMNRKIIEEEGFDETKVRFYELMVEYHTQEADAWELCKCFHSIYDTRSVKADDSRRLEALQSCVVYLLLAPFTNESSDMMHRVALYKDLEAIPNYKQSLKLFTTPEIIAYPFEHMDELHARLGLLHPTPNDAAVEHWTGVLHTRLVQHNVRVVSKYYTRIRTERLGQLLGLSVTDVEKYLSEMVANDEVYVKIDRPQGICDFTVPRAPEGILSAWNSDITQLLSLMEATCHLVNRENMVHKI